MTLHDFVINRREVFRLASAWNARIRNLIAGLHAGIIQMITELPEEAYIASLLDLRYKDTFIPIAERERWWKRLQELVDQIPNDGDEAPEMNAPAPEEVNDDANMDPYVRAASTSTRQRAAGGPVTAQRLSYKDMMAARFSKNREIAAATTPYRELTPCDIKIDPLKKWAQLEVTYNKHAKLARKYLAIPATSAPVERLFSTGGRVVEKRRAALKPSTAKEIVFIHDNISLLNELEEELVEDDLYDEY
jgi:hAT family C-terminal dimerisation region